MNDDTDLNNILSGRYVPPPSTNLASRIIAAANVNKDVPFVYVAMQEIMNMIVLPKPAYALTACLIFGLILGTQFGLQVDNDTISSTQDWFSFAQMEEGDWL